MVINDLLQFEGTVTGEQNGQLKQRREGVTKMSLVDVLDTYTLTH